MSQQKVIDIWFMDQQDRDRMFKKGLFITLVFILITIWTPLPEIKSPVISTIPKEPVPTITIKWPELKPEEATNVALIPKKKKIPIPAEFLNLENEVIVQNQEIEIADPTIDTTVWESDLSMAGMAPTAPEKTLTLNTPGLEGPIFTKRVPPQYPKIAIRNRLQGYVILEATLTHEGNIEEVQVIKGLGKGRFGFEEAAEDALQKWTFLPGQLNGNPVNVRLVLRIDFKLQ